MPEHPENKIALEIVAKYNGDYCDFDEFATKEEQLIVYRYITREANRMQRRVMGLE
ncbi:hypothetical protein G6R29_05205 [Fructobacillus sp. M2-14]|uniref:Uncharacterized protein n=1 Tax=Fructobacillus broussonetiae TaxID=2713173 RepID=A0ABS5R1W2_9LACO|nr:hypothetical protein [Fructobacillus broussonetiae]MBS9339017.1 hypothetical protein [Fructobacillus broussonetiae]